MKHETPLDVLGDGKRRPNPVKGYQALISIAGTHQSMPNGVTLDAMIELQALGWQHNQDSGAWKPSDEVIQKVRRDHQLRTLITDEINNFWPPESRLTRADLLLQACVTQGVLDRYENT